MPILPLNKRQERRHFHAPQDRTLFSRGHCRPAAGAGAGVSFPREHPAAAAGTPAAGGAHLPVQSVENPLPNEPEEPQSPAGYLLRDYEGRLAIFREESNTPEMIFDVYTRLLPQADQERLTEGISAPDYETLTRLIEDYIS